MCYAAALAPASFNLHTVVQIDYHCCHVFCVPAILVIVTVLVVVRLLLYRPTAHYQTCMLAYTCTITLDVCPERLFGTKLPSAVANVFRAASGFSQEHCVHLLVEYGKGLRANSRESESLSSNE